MCSVNVSNLEGSGMRSNCDNNSYCTYAFLPLCIVVYIVDKNLCNNFLVLSNILNQYHIVKFAYEHLSLYTSNKILSRSSSYTNGWGIGSMYINLYIHTFFKVSGLNVLAQLKIPAL